MKFLKILWQILGILCSLLVLPLFVSAITGGIMQLEPSLFVYFFMYPILTSAQVAQDSGSLMGILNMAMGYAAYLITAIYMVYAFRRVKGWYKKAKQFDAEHKH
ncbi:hypothetical protein [Listeria costaricensis]|uniref:hypothetical protein n=1 Tax=Listeria costaricensis TaxID=2026604 RepID=UPI000C06BC8E|nr:hypothetical protein [Listeria costaricensis]